MGKGRQRVRGDTTNCFTENIRLLLERHLRYIYILHSRRALTTIMNVRQPTNMCSSITGPIPNRRGIPLALESLTKTLNTRRRKPWTPKNPRKRWCRMRFSIYYAVVNPLKRKHCPRRHVVPCGFFVRVTCERQITPAHRQMECSGIVATSATSKTQRNTDHYWLPE